MVEDKDNWWDNKNPDNKKSSSESMNVFTGNVGTISSQSPDISITPNDPNKFIMSQFLIGLLLIPIFAGFITSVVTMSAERAGDDTYYGDSYYFSGFDNSYTTIISDKEYYAWDAYFNIPDIDVSEIQEKDYWLQTEFSASESWGYCYFDMDILDNNNLIQSDDGSYWYSMSCWGDMEGYDVLLRIEEQTFTYAIDQDVQPRYASVDGDRDISGVGILLQLLPILIVLFYIGTIVWSFISKRKSLGFGLIGGIIIAPISFCFSMIFLSFIYWNNF